MSKTFRHLDNEEYAAKLLTTPLRPFLTEREYRNGINSLTLSIADLHNKFGLAGSTVGAGFDTLGEFLRLFGVPIEKAIEPLEAIGKYRIGQFYAQDWAGQEWNSEPSKAFRYNNSILMRPVGSFLRGVRDSFLRGGSLEAEYPGTFGEGKFLGRGSILLTSINPSDSPIAHILRGIAYAKLEMDGGFPYAKKNGKSFRDGLLDDVNPLLLEGRIYKLYAGAKESAHIKGMLPTVERMISAAKAKDGDAFQAAASSLYGKDIFGTSFRQGWMAIIANGIDNAEDLAQKLFIQGYRSPNAAPGWQDFDLRQVPKFFKRGGEIASGEALDHVLKFFERGGSSPMGQYDDLAYTFMKRGQKLSDFFRDVINEAGKPGSQRAADEVLYLLRSVKRTAPTAFKDGAWDTTDVLASFEQNYREGVKSGAFHEVSDEAFQYAKKTIEDTTQGYKSDIGWNAVLNPSKKFAASDNIFDEPKPDDLKRFWANPKAEDAETITPERLAIWRAKYRTHEQVLDETNGLFSEARSYQDNIKGAIKSANDRISRAEAILSGKRPPAANWETVRAGLDEVNKMSAALEDLRIVERPTPNLKDAFRRMEKATREAASNPDVDWRRTKVAKWSREFDRALIDFDKASAAAYMGNSPERTALTKARRNLDKAIVAADKIHDDSLRSEMLGVEQLASGGASAILDAKMRVRSMERQITNIDDMVIGFKKMTTTPDYIAQLAKAEPVVVGRVIGAFGSVMSGIRRLQLGNPGTAALNAIDTSIVKNMIFGGVVSGDDIIHAAKKNELTPRYGLMGEDLNDHFTSDVARYAFDKVDDSGFLGQLGAFTNKWENAGRATLGRVTYDRIAGKLVDLGMDIEVASKTALTEAMRFVDKIHVDYANASPFEKMIRGAVSLYPRFNANDAVNAAEYALKHGPEAYALVQIRQRQQEGSLDGRGAYFAGGDAMWGGLIGDPVAGMSFVRSMESGVLLGRTLLGQEKAAYAPFRVFQAVYGTANPAAESGMQALGLAPAKDKGALNKYDSLLSGVMAAVGREFGWDINFAPSDPILKGLGLNPGTARDKQWAMGGKFEQAVALRRGHILETGDAIQEAQMNTAKRAFMSILSPISARIGDKTDAAVMASIRDINNQVDAAAPEDQQFIKDALLSRPENKGLSPFIHRTPDEKYRSAQGDEAMKPILDNALASVQNPDSVNAKVGRAAGGFWSAAANAAHMVAGNQPPQPPQTTPSPDDGETYQWPVKREDGTDYPIVGPGETIGQVVIGQFSGKESTRSELASIGAVGEVGAQMDDQSGYVRIVINPQNILEGKDSSQLLNYELKPRIANARSAEEALSIVESYGQDAGSITKMMVAASKVDSAFWRPWYENILGARAIAAGQLEGGFAENAPGAMRSVRDTLYGWYSGRVNRAGLNAQAVSDWTLADARIALADDIKNGHGPIGVDFNKGQADIDAALSPTNFLLIKQRLPGGFIEAAERRAQQQEIQDFPENKIWRDRLASAIRTNPSGVSEVVDSVNAAIASGSPGLSSSFWQMTSRVAPGLYEAAANLDNYDHILAVRDNITLRDSRGGLGPMSAVSIPLIIRQLEINPGDAAVISFLRQNGLKDGSGARIDRAAMAWEENLATLPPEIANGLRVNIDAIAPMDPSFTGERAIHDFNLRTGLERNFLFEKLGTWTSDQSAVDVADVRTADLSLPTAPRSVAPDMALPVSSQAPPPSAPTYATLRSSSVRSSGTASTYTTEIPTTGIASRGIIRPATPYGADQNGRIVNTGMIPWIQDGLRQSQSTGLPLTAVLLETARTQNGTPSVDGYRAASAITNIASSTQNLAAGISPEYAASDAGRAVGGAVTAAGAGLGIYAGLIALGMTGVGAPIAAVGFGIVAGLQAGGVFDKKKSGGDNADNQRMQAERLALDRARFDEQLRQTSIRDIRTREQDLARALQGGGGINQAQRQQVQPRLAAFQRRPTFQSRIGLVDAVERAIGSAIKPRY